jgi:hypothetical protein
MTRILSTLVALALALAPASALALEEPAPVPVPAGIACPMPAPDATTECIVEDVMPGVDLSGPCAPDDAAVLPDAMTECIVEDVMPGVDLSDPCAPDAAGMVPEMCTVRPVECVVPADGMVGCRGIDDITVAPVSVTLYGIVAITLPDGTRIGVDGGTLLISESFISGTIGCNEFGGEITIENDLILVETTWSTKMACPDLATADAVFATILTGQLYLVGDGMTATLTGDAGQLELQVLETMLPLADLGHDMGHGMHRDGSLAWLLLAFPLVSAAGALFVGLTARRD